MYRVRLMFTEGQLVRLAIANEHGDPLMTWERSNMGLTEIETLVGREDVLKLVREFWGNPDPENELALAEDIARERSVEGLRVMAEAYLVEE